MGKPKQIIKKTFNRFGYQIGKIKKEVSHIPQKALVIISPRRVGSTWLMDCVRCHPLVDLFPNASFHELLVPGCPRYPGDLSNKINCKYKIEQSSGKYARIPIFDVSNQISNSFHNIRNEEYAIEKIHPKFFNNDKSIILSNIKIIKSIADGIEIKFAYLIRDPKATICSFLNYNKRNPEWGGIMAKDHERLTVNMEQTYKCIYEMNRIMPGMIVYYGDLINNSFSILKNVFCFLWPDANQEERELINQVSLAAVEATKRGKRMSSDKVFFGKTVGPISGNDGQYDHLFSKYSFKVDEIYKWYNKLLDEAAM